MADLTEAATIRARARAAAKALKDLLSEKTLSASLRKQVENLNANLGKTWKDLEADAEADPEPKREAALSESASVATWLESRIHTIFTEIADEMYGNGYVTRDERKALSHGIGQALDAFSATVMADMPDLYLRSRFDAAPEPAVANIEADKPVITESTEVTPDFIPLVEMSVRNDGTFPVKIIQPGWGSSGYYPAEVLERDGPKLFTPGVKLYWNHPTPTEERERPERDLRDLAAEFTTGARYERNGPAGPGLYAEAKALNGYQDAINELAPHIGVSIRALGRARPGNAEGRAGQIIEEISAAKSVDFVTQPGAGGQVLQLFEAQRTAHNPTIGGNSMEELQQLQEANAQLAKELEESRQVAARYQEAALLREAGDFVATELAGSSLPDITKARLQAQLSARPTVKDGQLDKDAYKALIAEAVKAEAEYIGALTGAGQVRGMGTTERPQADQQAALKESFARLGLSATAAEQAAKGR